MLHFKQDVIRARKRSDVTRIFLFISSFMYYCTGDLCDVFDGCHNSPCQNNGDCTDADDSASVQYTCTCTSDYAGDECQVLLTAILWILHHLH